LDLIFSTYQKLLQGGIGDIVGTRPVCYFLIVIHLKAIIMVFKTVKRKKSGLAKTVL